MSRPTNLGFSLEPLELSIGTRIYGGPMREPKTTGEYSPSSYVLVSILPEVAHFASVNTSFCAKGRREREEKRSCPKVAF